MIEAFANAVTDLGANTPDDVVNTGGRFNTYRSNYFSSLIAVLTEQFPVTAELVGPEFFDALVQEYATQIPPTSPVMGIYGERFAEFLEGFEPVQQVPYLADVARLEWARATAKTVIALLPHQISSEDEILQAINFPAVISKGATLLHSPYPVGTIWANHQQETPAPIADWKAETVAVWQGEDDIQQVIVPEDELECFAEILEGAPFVNYLQQIEDEEQVAVKIGAFINYLNLGFLTL
ncbi:hypothetical protein GUA87_02375 [Sneathiella sp. P13V-1]|uniref:HvfC/BufC N-terminal domain-containing protein n=1 Tax=Sneathiella sp. P13V-1 TaxID=2697366 RepID=UPI00187B1717|nr:DNA-binding domain-containing protein [Sneathiella sp. P13V-1]MBE7635675.1 hypothetical protein [Sneathiella sp. P13V-1]